MYVGLQADNVVGLKPDLQPDVQQRIIRAMTWFGSGKKQTVIVDDAFQRAAELLLRFSTLAMSSVDPAALERHPRKQRTLFAFHFGAIGELVARHNFDETRQLALAVRYLAHWYGPDAAETGSVTAIAAEIQGAEWESARDAGAAAMRAFIDDNDHRAPKQLAALLADKRFIIHP